MEAGLLYIGLSFKDTNWYRRLQPTVRHEAELHVTLILQALHWLWASYPGQFKVLFVTMKPLIVLEPRICHSSCALLQSLLKVQISKIGNCLFTHILCGGSQHGDSLPGRSERPQHFCYLYYFTEFQKQKCSEEVFTKKLSSTSSRIAH